MNTLTRKNRFLIIVVGLLAVLSLAQLVYAQDCPAGVPQWVNDRQQYETSYVPVPLLCLSDKEENSPSPVGLRPDAPAYALHGPYWVGTRTFVIEDPTNPIEVWVWYPALNPGGAAEAITYVAHWDKYQLGIDSSIPTDIYGHALAGAEVDVSATPYPLVVFSHGSGGEPVMMAWLLEHLASYGFVVIAPNHKEIVDATASDFPRSTIVRAQTIPRVLDYAETLTAATGKLAGMIDMERVAVTGQSYGGYTALAAGGARFDMTAHEKRCAALAPDDPGQAMCFLVPMQAQAEMARLAGLDSVPQGLWPAMGDARVDALVSIAGDSYMFDEKGLAEITVPVLALGGNRDTSTLYDWGVRPTYDNVSSQQKILVTLKDADHYIGVTNCADSPDIVGLYGDGMYFLCSDLVWDMYRAHDLMNHFTTAFLLDELKGDTEAAAALAPTAVDFPGITYEAKGF